MANIKISELNELETRHRNDLLPIVDSVNNETKKIKVEDLINENVELIAVSSTAPSECSLGDKYFNTTSNKIYTAIATDTWSSTGENAVEGILYVVFGDQSTYAYNGTTLVSVGGGSGSSDIVVVPTETPTEETKLEIEDEDFDFRGSEITDEYSESTEVGYSANYSNGHFQKKEKILWVNPNPTSSFGVQDITLNSDDYDLLLWLFSTNTNNNQYVSFETIKGKGIYACWSYNNGFLAREINYVNDTTYNIGNNLLNGSISNINTLPQYVIGYKF